jgi:hypothetical protein
MTQELITIKKLIFELIIAETTASPEFVKLVALLLKIIQLEAKLQNTQTSTNVTTCSEDLEILTAYLLKNQHEP